MRQMLDWIVTELAPFLFLKNRRIWVKANSFYWNRSILQNTKPSEWTIRGNYFEIIFSNNFMVSSKITILQKKKKKTKKELPLTLKSRSIQPMMHLSASCCFYEFLYLFKCFFYSSNIFFRLVPSIINAMHSLISIVNNMSQYTGR